MITNICYITQLHYFQTAENAMQEKRIAALTPSILWRYRYLPPLFLALFTLITRLLCSQAVYFADGPRHLQAIVARIYIIQPPGYWLFNRIAGVFSDPATAITCMNMLFSVVGVEMLYFTALLFASRKNSFLAALAYSSIFYIWFSGEVHSTYASQIFFPVSIFYLLVRFDIERKRWLLCLSALAFAIGAGMRPTDGIFLIPMILYFAATRLSRPLAVSYLALITVLCLGWVIPTKLAFQASKTGTQGAVLYVGYFLHVRSILTGVNTGTLANVARFVLPLLIAFWLVISTISLKIYRDWKQFETQLLFLWLLPASLFFTLVYISDAPYLDCITAAIVLLALSAPRRLALTAFFNAAIFLFFAPIPSQHLAINVWNCDVGKYTFFAIRHEWQPNLSDMQTEGLARKN
jgi:4-amino-4-deoxy-L-arabinose transferase-like glycosyltransferase